MSKLKQRPKLNKIYLNYNYHDAVEQNYDMIFWNEKYLAELKSYDIFDDSFGNTLDRIQFYKNRLVEILKVDYNEAMQMYYDYCKQKTEKVKRAAIINKRWYDIENSIGFNLLNHLEDFGQTKKELERIKRELGTWVYFLEPKL